MNDSYYNYDDTSNSNMLLLNGKYMVNENGAV